MRNLPSATARRDTRDVKRLTDIDVTKTRDDSLIEQHGLDRCHATIERPREIGAGEVRPEWLGSQGSKCWPAVQHIRRNQINRSEPPRVVKGEPVACIGLENQVIVGANLRGIDSPAAGHTEMKDHRVAPIGLDNPVFRSPTKRDHACAGEPLAQVDRKRPSQIGTPRLDGGQDAADQYRTQSANGRFYFGKFGHKIALCGVCERSNPSLEASRMNKTVSFGYEQVAPAEKTERVGKVFTSVARSYDRMNDAMSGGMHRLWKDRFVRRVKPRAGEYILDMAGGTGDIAFRMATSGGGTEAHITVADINADMLGVGIDRAADRAIDTLVWTQANAETLPFDDRSFDAYTIAFGIRNVTDIPKALREAHRVLKRGGRFFCLEFSTTLWPGFGEVYDAYSHRLVPKIGAMIAGDEDSYRYLIESIRRFPDMPTFEKMIGDAGFIQTSVEPMLGGLVAIHSGWKI